MAKLTVKAVQALREPGRYGDGNGLYVQVARGGSRQWLLRYMLAGKSREMGLGGLDGLTLADARKAAADARTLMKAGHDPIEARQADVRAAKQAFAKLAANTFRDVAAAYIGGREAEWRNDKHKAQWRSTLDIYAFPVIGDEPVARVDTDAVLRVLLPIWTAKPETASRLRGRIESVLDYAKTRGLRSGENPARWRGHLAHSLPKPGKLRQVRHHPALPWQQIGAFMTDLRARPAMAACALEFAILTAARSGEVLGARWREMDMDAGIWIVPAVRMKAGREHRVPLSAPALALLKSIQPLGRGPDSPVFPSSVSPQKPLSGMSMEMLLRRMNTLESEAHGGGPTTPRWCDRDGNAITPHGFRSTFRDWAGEATSHPADLAEAALAHMIRDKTVAAYARGDLLVRRAKLMADWSEWCSRSELADVLVPRQENTGTAVSQLRPHVLQR